MQLIDEQYETPIVRSRVSKDFHIARTSCLHQINALEPQVHLLRFVVNFTNSRTKSCARNPQQAAQQVANRTASCTTCPTTSQRQIETSGVCTSGAAHVLSVTMVSMLQSWNDSQVLMNKPSELSDKPV